MTTEETTIIRAERVVLPEGERAASVLIKDGRIQAIGPKDAVAEGANEWVLRDDEVLMPGLVDSHVHINEPGRTAWEGYQTATKAAAVGGITTVIDMPLNSHPPTVTVEALDEKIAASEGKLSVDVGFWGGAIPGNKDDLAPLWNRGVFGFKCFTAHSGIDEYGYLEYEDILRDLQELAAIGSVLIVHAEDPQALADAPQKGGREYANYLASRPKEAENQAIMKVIEAARVTGGRVHILHLASAEALPIIRKAKDDGVKITVETCSHYLTFAAENIPDGATEYKCAPPLREDANRRLLWQGLKDGTIDHIASDHSPCTVELKNKDTGDFGTAWGGVASVQLGVSAIWTAGEEFGITLNDLARWFGSAPSASFGIPRKGSIAVGNDADFAVLVPEETFTVDAAQLEHRNKISPYHGRQLRGVVRETMLRGQKLSENSLVGRRIRRA